MSSPQGNNDSTVLVIDLYAGIDRTGNPVLEKLPAEKLDNGVYKIRRSPLFVRNLARDDLIKLDKRDNTRFTVSERSGQLAIRFFRKSDIAEVEQWLTPQVEKLDGRHDLSTEHGLVYSMHVNLGFSEVEQLMDNATSQFSESVWYYGNVYDPEDGMTPLLWWNEFINQV